MGKDHKMETVGIGNTNELRILTNYARKSPGHCLEAFLADNTLSKQAMTP